jgi:plastocyanin
MVEDHPEEQPPDQPRSRVGIPLVMLLILLAGIGLFLFSLSRVLLAIPAGAAAVVALAVAGFVLLVAGTLGQNRLVSGRALGVALLVGLLGLAGAGVAALEAGPREIEPHGAEGGHAEEEHAENGEEGGDGGGEELPEDALVWVAQDIEFLEAPESAPAGEVTIAIDNQGASDHDVTIEELGVTVEAAGGEVASETVEVEPGTYYYYCSVPGHEESMSGEITFE